MAVTSESAEKMKRSCRKKRRWARRGVAELYAVTKRGKRLGVYECPVCWGFHHTSQKPGVR